MTVEVYSGPGTSAYQSTRYSATVQGLTAYVYGFARTAVMPTQAWSAGATVEPAWFQFGADETATVAITRLAGPITSAVVYPKDKGVTQSIAGGVLTLTIPTNVRVWVECNGDRVPLLIQSRPLKPALPVARTDWTATPHLQVVGIDTGTNVLTLSSSHGWTAGTRVVQTTTTVFPNVTGTAISATEVYYVINPSGATLQLARTPGGTAIDFTSGTGGTWRLRRAMWTDTVNSLYFGPGVHTIGRNFYVGDNTDIYIDGGAVLVGSFNVEDCTVMDIRGAGQVFATYALWAEVVGLSFEEQVNYAVVNGYGRFFYAECRVTGIMFAAWPFYFCREGVTDWQYCLGVSPWNYNNDGFECSARFDLADSTVNNCIMFCGDDTLYQDSNWFSLKATDLFGINSNGGTFLFGYWGEANGGKTQTLEDCDAISLSLSDTALSLPESAVGGNAVIKLWNDNFASEAALGHGRFNIVIDGMSVWGNFDNMFLTIENRAYPFNDALIRDSLGDVKNVTLRDIYLEDTPGQLSRINGKDWLNTPHDIFFENVVIGETRLTAWNWSQFFERNVYPYNITVEGQPVVTAVELCNRALTAVGDAGVVTSISPPDNTKQALLCQRFYPQAVNEVLQLHPWGCATTRIALTLVTDGENDAWRYCYEVPAGLLTAIEMLPPNAADDYRDQDGLKVPFRFERDEDGVVRIYSNLENAILRYTVYETDPNKFDPMLQEAIVQRLAAKLVGPIRGGAEGDSATVRHLQLADEMIRRARQSDGNQRVVKTRPQVTWITGR